MLVIFSIYDRARLLPYFLKYYASIGATQFVCGLFNGTRNPLYEQIVAAGAAYELQVKVSVECPVEKHRGASEIKGLNRIREEFATRFGWYCIADLDEFHFFFGQSLSKAAAECKRVGCDAIHGLFFDRIASDGTFPEINGALDETFPLVGDLTRCSGLCSRKIVLARDCIPITPGHHKANGKVMFNGAEVHHFKWSKGICELVEEKLRRYRKQNIPWAMQQLPYLCELIKSGIDLSNPQLQVRKATVLGV